MKFLYVAPRYHTNQMDIMKGLVERGHEVCFISHYAAAIEDYSCVTPVVLGYSRLYRLLDHLYVNVIHRKRPEAIVFKIQHGFPPLLKLRKLICDFRPDVVILRERSAYSMAAYLICRKKGYPCILYNQNPLWSAPAKTDLAHRIVGSMTPKLRMTPVMGVKRPGTSVKEHDFFVPFVIEPQKAPEERTYFASDTVHILCIGKYEPRKHHLLLLQVVEELLGGRAHAPAGKLPDRFDGGLHSGGAESVSAGENNGEHGKAPGNYKIRLTLVGEATMAFQKEYCEQVRRYVADHHMEDIVTVKTNVPRREMEAEYLAADVYVIPSTREMASVSQLEAMSYSLPVICSDANGTASYVEDGLTGYQFRDCDRQDLSDKLEKMLSDRERMKAMGAAGYRALMEKYSFETYQKAIQAMLEKMQEQKLY